MERERRIKDSSKVSGFDNRVHSCVITRGNSRSNLCERKRQSVHYGIS